MKTVKIVSIILASVVATFFVSNLGLGSKRKTEADASFVRFAEAIRLGKYQDAYTFTDAQFKAVTTVADFTAQVEGMRAKFGRLHTVRKAYSSVQRFGFSGPWHATETADFVFERGVVRVTFEMENETNLWLIRGYRRTE
jgi:hypothetical protein